jgi:hypothetical protein
VPSLAIPVGLAAGVWYRPAAGSGGSGVLNFCRHHPILRCCRIQLALHRCQMLIHRDDHQPRPGCRITHRGQGRGHRER